jgi:inorganic pyrophosphatase
MIKVLIQVAGGSTDRRIYNERTLEYKETRKGTLPYPYPYGFILGTWSEDEACVDCYVITQSKLEAGSIVECEVAGLLEQHEGEEIDHKVLGVLSGEQVELSQEIGDTLRNFIYTAFAKHLEVKITVGNILPREEALRHIEMFRER